MNTSTIPVMAKKRVSKPIPPPAVQVPPPEEKEKRERKGYNMNVWIDAELGLAFERLLAKTRRFKTAEVELMVEEHLARNGLWPPPTPRT